MRTVVADALPSDQEMNEARTVFSAQEVREALNTLLVMGDCPDCGAASGHWPSCPRYPGK